MSDEQGNILEAWSEVKALVGEAEVDVLKNANGNSAAGVRARRALRLLKGKTSELVKLTIAEEKTRKGSE
jgi:hypothetical protein